MNNNDFDNIIKQASQQHEADVPGDIWEAISKKKKNRRFPFFWLILFFLLTGIGILMLNQKNKKSFTSTTTAEKTTTDKSNLPKEKKLQNENIVAPSDKNINKESLSINKNPDAKKLNKTSDNNEAVKNNNQKRIDSYPGDNSVNRKNSIRLRQEKKNTLVSSTTSQSNDLFTANKNKRTSRGKTRLNIIAGTTSGDDEQSTFVSNDKNPEQANKSLKNIQGDSSLFGQSIPETETSKPGEIKTSMVNEDSLISKKIPALNTDSLGKKTTIIKSTIENKHEQKNNGLKIEAGLSAIFPTQKSKQPLYVKRTIDGSNTHAEFISDNIKTSVEPGTGFFFNIIKNISKKWNVGTGINYSRFTETVKMSGIETKTNYTIVQRLDTNASGTFLKVDTVSSVSKYNTTINGRNIYSNLSIPLLLRWQFITRKKWSCALSTGLYVDLVRTYQNKIPGRFESFYSTATVSGSSKTTMGIDIFAGLHFSGHLYKKYDWLAASVFNYSFTSYKTNSLPLDKKIHTPMISLGISYQLRK